MASASAVGLHSCLCLGTRTQLGNPGTSLPLSNNWANRSGFHGPPATAGKVLSGRQRSLSVVAKAVGDGSDSSESIVKYLQNAWGDSEDRIALVGLGFAGIVAVWSSGNLIAAIDKLPVVPSFLEFVGILYTWWFVYRYLLFKPDRAELVQNVKKSISDVLGK